MKHYALKIKLKSLAAEAHIIRKEQQRFLNKAKYFQSQNKNKAASFCREIADDLRHHRITVVRKHARATHIAYAYLKGRDPHDIDTNLDTFHEVKECESMLKKYGNKEMLELFRNEFRL